MPVGALIPLKDGDGGDGAVVPTLSLAKDLCVSLCWEDAQDPRAAHIVMGPAFRSITAQDYLQMQHRNAVFLVVLAIKAEFYSLLQHRRDRPCSPQAFHLTPAIALVPAPIFAVVLVSAAWPQLLNQWPEISLWQPQVAQRLPVVLRIWAVISAVILTGTGVSGPEGHFVVLGTMQMGKGCQC